MLDPDCSPASAKSVRYVLSLTAAERSATEQMLLGWEMFVSEAMDWPETLEIARDSLSD